LFKTSNRAAVVRFRHGLSLFPLLSEGPLSVPSRIIFCLFFRCAQTSPLFRSIFERVRAPSPKLPSFFGTLLYLLPLCCSVPLCRWLPWCTFTFFLTTSRLSPNQIVSFSFLVPVFWFFSGFILFTPPILRALRSGLFLLPP